MNESVDFEQLDVTKLPGMNPGAAMRQELILSFVSILILIGIVLFLRKLIKNHDKKKGKKESHPFRTIVKWYYIVVALLAAIFVWTGNVPTTSFIEKAMAVGIPLGMIVAASSSNGWKTTLGTLFTFVIVSAVGVFILKIASNMGFQYADQVVKGASSLFFVISAFSVFKTQGEFIAKETSYYSSSSTYSGSSSYSTSSSSSSQTDPFSGGNFKRKRDIFGNIEYIDEATGQVKYKGKENYWGEETITDSNGKVVLKEKDYGIFGSSYQDSHGNTKYRKDTDIFGDHQIKDNYGNVKYEDDALERWITGESNYKKK